MGKLLILLPCLGEMCFRKLQEVGGVSYLLALVAVASLLFAPLGTATFAQSAPTVEKIVLSYPGIEALPYYRGDDIYIVVRFSEAVELDTSGGTPYMTLQIGTSLERAQWVEQRVNPYVSSTIKFGYVVQPGDMDDDGYEVVMNSIQLNGATIRRPGTMVNADLSHDSVKGDRIRNLTDKKILEILYDETGGNNWTTSTNWKTSESLDMWHGVTTNTDGQVTVLDLRTNQLSGEIPRELGYLSSIQKLWLSGNQLNGEIPSALGNLASLQDLLLSGNQLNGEMPSELGNLTSLTRLLLSGNQLSGEMPSELGNLTSLTNLVLNDNQLSGEIPSELGNLTSLTELQAVNNQLSGEIPSELGNLTSLRRLDLARNQLSGEMPSELGNLTNSTFFSLASNQLSGEIPSALGNLTSVTTFQINDNQLSGEIPSELGDLTNLRSLYLENNQLSGEIPSELGNMTNLRQLWLSSNQLSGEIPSELGNLTNLQRLILFANQLSGEIPSELGNMTNLRTLNLRTNQLSGEIPSELGNMTSLRYLYLHRNELNGEIPSEIAELPSLQLLHLSSNMLKGAIPLTELEALTDVARSRIFLELALWDNGGLTGTELVSDELGKRVDRAVLASLYWDNGGSQWDSTGVSRGTPQAWRPFSGDYVLSFGEWYGVGVNSEGRISTLDLNDNNLKGPITNALEELEHLETLNLADNPMLSGTLPDGLFSEDTKLTGLDIQNTDICVPDTQAFKEWLDSPDTVFTVGNCPFISTDLVRIPTLEQQTPEMEQQTPEMEQQTPEMEQQTPEMEQQTPEMEQQTPEMEQQTPNISGGGGGCAIASEGWKGYGLGNGLSNLFLIISFPLWVLLGSRLRPERGS